MLRSVIVSDAVIFFSPVFMLPNTNCFLEIDTELVNDTPLCIEMQSDCDLYTVDFFVPFFSYYHIKAINFR